MNTQCDPIIHHTAKPVVAGIFNTIVGSLGILSVLIIGFGMVMFNSPGKDIIDVPVDLSPYALFFALPLAGLGTLSIVGGVCNLKRRKWGWALAGSIATAILTGWGVAS